MDIDPYKNEISAICDRFAVQTLEVFGSVAKGSDTDRSDIDFLVTFSSGSNATLFAMFRLEDELSKIFEREVHVVSRGAVHPQIANEVYSQAKPVYAL